MKTRLLMGILLGCALALWGCASKPDAPAVLTQQETLATTPTVTQTPTPLRMPSPAPTQPPVQPMQTQVDWRAYFDGIDGCAVMYRPASQVYTLYNKTLCEMQSSPCSTFKIVSTLLGLEYGAIDPDHSVLPWNGTKYWNADWNRDIDLQQAFRTSCVWYYREVINRLGEADMQAGLDGLQYGNCDISDWEGRINANQNNRDLTGFWLESSLKISPIEQVEVLSRIFEGSADVSEKNVELLRSLMLVPDNEGIAVYGKTGTGKKDGKTVNAWFVGMFDQDDETVYFAVRLTDPDHQAVSSTKAKQIALEIINNEY